MSLELPRVVLRPRPIPREAPRSRRDAGRWPPRPDATHLRPVERIAEPRRKPHGRRRNHHAGNSLPPVRRRLTDRSLLGLDHIDPSSLNAFQIVTLVIVIVTAGTGPHSEFPD